MIFGEDSLRRAKPCWVNDLGRSHSHQHDFHPATGEWQVKRSALSYIFIYTAGYFLNCFGCICSTLSCMTTWSSTYALYNPTRTRICLSSHVASHYTYGTPARRGAEVNLHQQPWGVLYLPMFWAGLGWRTNPHGWRLLIDHKLFIGWWWQYRFVNMYWHVPVSLTSVYLEETISNP